MTTRIGIRVISTAMTLVLIAIGVIVRPFTIREPGAEEAKEFGIPILTCPDFVDSGESEYGQVATGRFNVRNDGSGVLTIDKIRTSCTCAGLERHHDNKYSRLERLEIAPGGTEELVVRQAVNSPLGT